MLFKDVAGKLLKIQMQQLMQSRQKGKIKAIERMKEMKALFGDLVETKAQKRKRLKYEQKQAIPPQVEPKIDTEPEFFRPDKILARSNEFNSRSGKRYEYQLLKMKFNSNGKEGESRLKKATSLRNYVEKKQSLAIGVMDPSIKKDTTLDTPGRIMTLRSRDHVDGSKYASVTRILNATMSEEARAMLDRWEKRMIVQMGIEGFQIYKQELLRNGKHLHAAIHGYLLQEPIDVHENVEPAFESVHHILKDMSEVKAIESHVVHPQLHYRGYLDCIARYRGKLCLVDWKKSDKQKSSIMSTYDAPLQVASYIGALNADEKYPFEISRGLIVVCYSNGDRATVHEIKGDLLQLYWKAWLDRLQKYRSRLEDVTTDAEIKLDP